MRIDCGEVQVRSYRPDDLEALVRYANNPRVAANLRDRFPFPYTREDGEEWLAAAAQQDPEANFVIATARELIGTIGLSLGDDVYRHSAEVGYWIAEPFWGQGITTRVVRAFTEWGFAEFGLLRIYAHVFSENVASARVLEKAGYEREGTMRQAVVKNGRVMDQWIYARLSPAEGEEWA